MCRLVNRIRYGKSDRPRFIKSKQHWLYKSKWITSDRAYDILSHKTTKYTYELLRGEYASFGELDSFDAVVDLVAKYPTQVTFSDLSQFSMQEVDVILGIQKEYVKNRQDNIMKKMREAEEEIAKIGIKFRI